VARTEGLASNSFCASKWRAVRSASFSCAASYLKSAIRPSPSLFRHMADNADHGLRHFIEVGVDQVRQSSASSFETMPVEPTRSQNMTVSGGVHERWLSGRAISES
jgi:hypothetical protein